MEVDKKKTRTDEAWYGFMPASKRTACCRQMRNTLRQRTAGLPQVGERFGSRDCRNRMFAAWWAVPEQGGDSRSLLTEENREKPTLVKTLEDGSVVYLAQESTLKYLNILRKTSGK